MFQKLLTKTAQKLNSFQLPYMVIGGQAVLLYGEPRLTKDIDIIVGAEVDRLDDLICIVKELKLTILVDSYKNFVKKTMVLPVGDKTSGILNSFKRIKSNL